MPFDPAYKSIFPRTTAVRDGRLSIGGCDAQELTREFGSPLYVFDETELRETCREYVAGVHVAPRRHGDHVRVEGVPEPLHGLHRARRGHRARHRLRRRAGGRAGGGLPGGALPLPRQQQGRRRAARGDRRRHRPHHRRQLPRAGAAWTGIARALRACEQPIILRLSPGVDAHTHAKTTTGTLDNKFGLPDLAPARRSRPSPTRSALAARRAGRAALPSRLAAVRAGAVRRGERRDAGVRGGDARRSTACELREYSPGGGFASQYVREKPAPPVDDYAEAIVSSFKRRCAENGLPLPHLFVEPGRSLVARAGVALYTVGARKEIEGLRTWVSVDGGMADNIRPAIYDAKYEAVVVNRADDEPLRDGDDRREVLRVGRHPREGRAAAARRSRAT